MRRRSAIATRAAGLFRAARSRAEAMREAGREAMREAIQI
jgi:hypothetical protein